MKSFKDRKLLLSLLALGLCAGFGGRLFEVGSHADIGSPTELNSASAILATESNLLPSAPILPTVSLGFAGNIIFSGSMDKRVAKNYNGDYSQLFSQSDFLKKSDMVFANLEGTINDITISSALKNAGVGVVSLTGSHIMDNGRAAFENSLSELHASGISTCGAGMTKEEATQPGILSKDGFTVGYLCFSDIAADTSAATNETSGVLLASDPDFDSIIKNATQKADALIVAFNFGSQSGSTHNARQQELAHRAADDGAVLVVGTHPDTEQEIASYNGVPILYSLGNLISDQASKDFGGIFVTATLKDKSVSNVTSSTLSFNKNFIPYLAQ